MKEFAEWWDSSSLVGNQFINKEVWSSCWRLEGPPRVLTFLWILLDNNVPVRDNLRRRGIEVDTTCPLCDITPKIAVHLFIECPISKGLISSVGLHHGLKVFPLFTLAWEDYALNNTKKDCGKLLAALWGIWKVRNARIFEDPNSVDPSLIMKRAIKFCDDYIEAQSSREHQCPPRQSQWSPPPPGFININTDAGMAANGGGQVSAIARDEQGIFVEAAIKLIPGAFHPTLLEAHGVLLRFKLAKECHCYLVILESDCQSLVLALQSGKINKSDLATLVEDCLEASKEFQEVSFNFVRRSANQVVHSLAKMQGLYPDIVHFYASPPSSITDDLCKDVSADI